MRRTLIGLATAGLLAVTGCSDSDAGGPDVAAENGGGSVDQFCADVEALNERFDSDPDAANDVDAVIEAVEGLDAPDEIADDLAEVVAGARAQAELDPNDGEAAAELEDQLASAAAAQERLGTFVEQECDIETSLAG
jgi:hypothetical protein